MLKLKPSNATPPDKFTYRFPDGHTISAIGREEWRDKAHEYAKNNNYPIPTDAEMEDFLCRRLSGEWCEGGDANSFVDARFTFDDFLRGSKVLGSFALGDVVVSQAEADRRALICSRCPVNMEVAGCKACSAISNLIGEMKGTKKTPYDHLLKSCGICHCPNEVQIWVQPEHLAKGVTPKMMAQFEQITECWKGKLLKALDAEAQTA